MTEENQNDLTKALQKAFAAYPTEDTETPAMPDTDANTEANADFKTIYTNALTALNDLPQAMGESADGRIIAALSPDFELLEIAGLEHIAEADRRGIIEAVNEALASMMGGIFDKLGALAPSEAK
jgi:hypothetical protein